MVDRVGLIAHVKTDSLLCEHFHEKSDEIRTVPGYGENSFLSGTE